MSNNVHALPIHTARGRRRVRPMPDVPLCDVLRLEPRLENQPPTPDEKIAEMEVVITEITRALLVAVRVISAHDKRHRKG